MRLLGYPLNHRGSACVTPVASQDPIRWEGLTWAVFDAALCPNNYFPNVLMGTAISAAGGVNGDENSGARIFHVFFRVKNPVNELNRFGWHKKKNEDFPEI